MELNVAVETAVSEVLFDKLLDTVSELGAKCCSGRTLEGKAGAGWRGSTFESKAGAGWRGSAFEGKAGVGWGGCALEGNDEAGKEDEVRLAVFGINEGGYSGKFDPGRLNPPVGIDELKGEYCICGMEGGIDNPGGGRSSDCWGNWGSPFGAP